MKVFLTRLFQVLVLAGFVYLVLHIPSIDRPEHTTAEVKGMYPEIRKECWEMTGEAFVNCATGRD